MYVNVEFLGAEPLENVITAMHFKMDKTIYFGYREVLAEHKNTTDKFLKRYCGVDTVEFHALSEWNLQEILGAMRVVLQEEYKRGNQVFFDVTGGESLVLVAFGILSKEFSTPMHLYDVERDKLIELEEGVELSISNTVPHQTVQMNLDKYVELRGGVINYDNQKDIKRIKDEEDAADVIALWQIVKQYGATWNAFCDFVKNYCKVESGLDFAGRVSIINNALRENKNKRLNEPELFQRILRACVRAGALQNLECTHEWYRFRYKSGRIKALLCDPGAVLELYTYLQEREHADDCRVGVSLDWDGVIHAKNNQDVHNEVDVLTLHGIVPTFISCKNGSVDQMALYELQTVADQFGGKYAKKAIVATQGLNGAHGLRAEEMEITVRTVE